MKIAPKITILLTTLIFFFSCSKSDIITSNFTWTYNGTLYKADLDTAYSNAVFGPTIFAAMRPDPVSLGSRISIILANFNTGAHNIVPGNPSPFHFIDAVGNDLDGTAGILNITSNTNNRMSGNFSVTLSNSQSITGNFTDTPKKQ